MLLLRVLCALCGEFVFSTAAEKSCLIHIERPLNCVRGDMRDWFAHGSMTQFLRVLRGELIFSREASRSGEIDKMPPHGSA